MLAARRPEYVKRRDLEAWLRQHGAAFPRHGGDHDIWHHEGREASVPRHREIGTGLGRKICEQLGLPRFRDAEEWRRVGAEALRRDRGPAPIAALMP